MWENNDWVRLKLTPGQCVKWGKSYPTDEGWGAEGCAWMHDGNRVLRRWWSDGVDCDGRLSRNGVDVSRVVDLAAVQSEQIFNGRIICRPDWEQIDSTQRDYTAEAAGY